MGVAQSPTLEEIRETSERLSPYVVRTPTTPINSALLADMLGSATRVFAKLETFQKTGSFKIRGALNTMLAAGPAAQKVTAISAGNHAIAVAYAAHLLDADARVVMLGSASPLRRALASKYGADLVIENDIAKGFERVEEIVESEQRLLIHPFDGQNVTMATAGVGLEFIEDCPDLDAVIVAIGGGGLAGGVGSAMKAVNPQCAVYGVEPEGAASMHLSFHNGAAATLDHVTTIADSLAPPKTTDHAFAMCRDVLEEVVLVSDNQLAAGVALMLTEFKMAVEPAAAAALAALIGPLKEKLAGKSVGLVICGSNIDAVSYGRILDRGQRQLEASGYAY